DWFPLGFKTGQRQDSLFRCQNFGDTPLITDYHWSLSRPGLSHNLYLFVNGFIKRRLSLEAQSACAKTDDSFVVDQNVSGKSINSEGPLHLAVAIPELCPVHLVLENEAAPSVIFVMHTDRDYNERLFFRVPFVHV